MVTEVIDGADLIAYFQGTAPTPTPEEAAAANGGPPARASGPEIIAQVPGAEAR